MLTVTVLALAALLSPWRPALSLRARLPRMTITEKVVEHNGAKYEVTIAGSGYLYPPVLLVPPVGVGIDRKFYSKLQTEWDRLGLPVELHAIDLLGCGSSTPLPRRFYTPELWAEQALSYVSEHVGRPCIVLVQGGMVPVALELWRRGGGRPTIAGVVFASPPPFQFFAPSAVSADATAPASAGSRLRQRLFWLLSQSSVGGVFFRCDAPRRLRRPPCHPPPPSLPRTPPAPAATCAAGAAPGSRSSPSRASSPQPRPRRSPSSTIGTSTMSLRAST